MTLSPNQQQRYVRNILIPEIGEVGQEKLQAAKVLVIGAGGLGSPLLFYLAAAGVGKIGIIDDDKVELSNLQRQIIHNQQNLGELKTESAKSKLNLLNEEIKIETYPVRADQAQLDQIIPSYDLVCDATDNFSARFAINASCIKNKKPLVFAAVRGLSAQIAVFRGYEKTNPCYTCFNQNADFFSNYQLTDQEKGILGAVAGSAGAVQATFAIKEILGLNKTYQEILTFDFLKNNFRKIHLAKNSNCKICNHD